MPASQTAPSEQKESTPPYVPLNPVTDESPNQLIPSKLYTMGYLLGGVHPPKPANQIFPLNCSAAMPAAAPFPFISRFRDPMFVGVVQVTASLDM
jgi:hypothetical protein